MVEGADAGGNHAGSSPRPDDVIRCWIAASNGLPRRGLSRLGVGEGGPARWFERQRLRISPELVRESKPDHLGDVEWQDIYGLLQGALVPHSGRDDHGDRTEA